MKELLLRLEDRELVQVENHVALVHTRARLEGVPLPKADWVDMVHMLSPLQIAENWANDCAQSGIQMDHWTNTDRRTTTWRFRWDPDAKKP